MADLRSQCPKWLYIGRQDDHEHGPYTSTEMLHWLRCSYFDGSLRLRTENDIRFYTLAEWVQACENKVNHHRSWWEVSFYSHPFLDMDPSAVGTPQFCKIPFTLDVHSMESLQSNVNNSRTYGSVQLTDNVQIDQFLHRLPINPVSTANPLMENAGSERPQIPLGMPIQLLPASQKAPPTSQVLLMNAQPSPNQPLVIPVSSVPTYQFVQQHMFPSMSQQQPLMPMRVQAATMLPHQMQQRLVADAEQSQQEGTIASDSPDSGHVITPSSYPLQQIGNGLECIDLAHQRQPERIADSVDGSWKRGVMLTNDKVKMVDCWTSTKDDVQHFQQAKGTQTDDLLIKVSREDAERLLFQLLGIRIRINFAT